jgi:ubiquinone/menaquinone biosynthesis C-methylase UbiE/cytosine/adenosine deaminase-related metal-dependent hydrolase
VSLQRTENIESTGNQAAFSAWAKVYDEQPNPLLSLEERYLSRVLPAVRGKDVLDAGCGTGRWLRRLADQAPRSLHGIDSSSEMLAAARHALPGKAMLILAQLPMVPIVSDSIDLALCSFALSYISDIQTLAQQLRRVLRQNGNLLITDIHPDTAATLGWKRGFNALGAHFHLATHNRSLSFVQDAFEGYGFEVAALYQPRFDEPERSVFIRGGKDSYYDEAAAYPAIYILHLRCAQDAIRSELTLNNAKVVLGKQEVGSGDISMDDKRVVSFRSDNRRPSPLHSVDLSGYTLFPGLINAHDHLEFALFPRLGSPPYRNATEWAHEIHERCASTIEMHTAVPRNVRFGWGALRNLLCGVTTVCHHNPVGPELASPKFPLRVVSEFDWAHSLAFSSDLLEIHQRSVPPRPFILHACEGIDEDAHGEFAQLLKMNVVRERTVLVHGLAMGADEISDLNRHGASLISCPSSNYFLFHRAPLLEKLISVDRLAIGSDSPLTADGDLLDEISFCHNMLKMHPEIIFDLVTTSPASILRLRDRAGSIAPDASSDCFAVRSSALPPAQHLVSLLWYDVELVIVGGMIRIASDEIFTRLPMALRGSLEPLSIDGVTRWIGFPVAELFQTAANVLGTDNVSIHGRRILVPSMPNAN